MSRARLLPAITACVVLAMACACSGTRSTQAARSPSPAGATPETFPRWGYRFVPPEGTTVRRGTREWSLGQSPHRDTHVFDTFVSVDGDPWIVIGRRPVRPGVSLSEWIRTMEATHTTAFQSFECRPVEDDRPTTLDTAPARMRAFHCPIDGPQAIGVQVLALYRGGGWLVMCYSERDEGGQVPAFEQRCQEWLRTFHFLR